MSIDASPEIAAAMRERLSALGLTLAKKRAEAIRGREQSGIEHQWREDEEFYAGIDDANRHEAANAAWRTKPPGMIQAPAQGDVRSTVFLNITGPYCDIAAARFADMVLPNDSANFKIEPTPVVDLIGLSEGKLPPRLQRAAEQEQGSETLIAQAVKQAAQMMAQAKASAEKAQMQIEDWHIEGQWHAEVRRVIEDAARIGSGVLKGPYPTRTRAIAFKGGALIVEERITPKSRRIDVWDFFPDPSCGDSIHNGAYTWERDRITARKLMELIGVPGYLPDQINECLREGPLKATSEATEHPEAETAVGIEDSRFEVWHFHGVLDSGDMQSAGCKCVDGRMIPASVTMVNNRVIKATLNPLDTGDFPYDVMPWRRRRGMPWGDGIARQIRTAQRIVNAGVRSMMDNSGLASGPQIVMNQGMIRPADGRWALTPRKIWYVSADSDTDDVRKAMTFFDIPSQQERLMAIVNLGLKLAEDTTGLPMILQGQQGGAPDTVGGMTILNNNASSAIRRIARTFDDCVTEPHIRREYAWLLQYGEDDDAKGDFTINARASGALVERDSQSAHLGQLLPASLNPVYGLDPKKAMTEWLKAMRFDPLNFNYDDPEWQKVVQNMSQPKPDSAVDVAKIRAENDQQLQAARQQFEAAEAAKDRQNRIVIEMIDERMTSTELTALERDTLAKIKAGLAQTVLKINAQKELAAHDHAVQMLTPPTEPVGRAQNGHAFQQ